MEISLLGPPQISIGGRKIDIGVRKQRFLLTVLAIEANHHVSTERLIDLIWPKEPPPTARGMIHTYVSGLRRIFQITGASDEGVWLERQESGYALRCDPGYVDAHRFQRLIGAARGSADDKERVALLDQALALWRGPALAGVVAEEVRTRLSRTLEETRLFAVEERMETLIRLDRHDGLLDQLLRLGDENPMRPRITSMLMRELHRAGRSAEALDFFRHYQSRVGEELGLDPPEQLQQLHLAILRNDPELSTTTTAAVAGPDTSSPRQLPGDLSAFVGRETELAQLIAAFRADAPATVVINAIDGMAGIGKTVLAVHAAHQLSGQFADGQLFVNLHGFTYGVLPVDPADALVQLLHGLGVSGQQVPHGLDARAALYRTVVANKRVLIVLDNAADEDQVVPLLPGAQGCGVLVTSRNRLAGLPNAQPLSLGLLPACDAQTLFTNIAGRNHRAEAISEIIDLCGRLPLAVRIAAARLRTRVTWTADHLAQRLRDQRNRLTELGSGHLGVAAAIDLSYRQLGTAQQRLYRLLGLHPGPGFDTHAAAALATADPRPVGGWLEDLVDAHLLHATSPGRYQLHDLVRAHAAETADRDEPPAERELAITGLLAYYASTASIAMDKAYPYDSYQRPSPPPSKAPPPPLVQRDDASAWLDDELANLMATANAANRRQPNGSGHHLVHLSATLHSHLRTRGQYPEAEWLHAHAVELAREQGDLPHEARALNRLGGIQHLQGRYVPAIECFERVLRIGALGEQSEATWGLGYIAYMKGHNEQAEVHYGQALRLARKQGDPVRELNALRGLGHVRYTEADYAPAIAYFNDALVIARRMGHWVVEMDALRGLGNVHLMQGQYDDSARYFEQCLRIAREVGHVHGQLSALRGLANAHRTQGNADLATECYQQSLHLARTIGDPNSEFEAMHGLGEAHRMASRLDEALACYETALALARGLTHRDDEARAANGLAHTHLALGDYQQARFHWLQVLAILAELNIRQVEEVAEEAVRGHLSDLERRLDAAARRSGS